MTSTIPITRWLTLSSDVLLHPQTQGAVLRGLGASAPHSKVWPSSPLNEVHHADILTEVYAIASLGLQVQVCQ